MFTHIWIIETGYDDHSSIGTVHSSYASGLIALRAYAADNGLKIVSETPDLRARAEGSGFLPDWAELGRHCLDNPECGRTTSFCPEGCHSY